MIVSIHRAKERSTSRELVVLAVFLGLTCLLLPSLVLAQTQSHPLSEITPMDVNLNLTGMNITNVSYVFFGNNSIDTYLYRSASGVLSLVSHLLVSNWVNASSFNASNQICLGGVCKSSWPSSLVGGSGTANHIPLWSASDTLGNSLINQTGSNVWITSGSLNLVSGALQVGGTTVIDSLRNIINAGWVNATNLNASTAIYGQTIYEGGTALSSKYGSSSHTHDAANISSGTLSNARLDTNIYWINSSTGLSASNISSGNLAIARMPTGGAWSLTSDLNINSNTLVVDQDASRVGIGTAAPSSALEVYGGDIEINDGAATGTYKIKGKRNFYAGDETEVSTTSTSYTLKKQFTAIFDDTYGIKPTYVNVIVRIKNSDGNQTSLNVTLEGCASKRDWNTTSTSYTLIKDSIDVSACVNGAYPTKVYLKTNSTTGTAYNDIIEFYLVE